MKKRLNLLSVIICSILFSGCINTSETNGAAHKKNGQETLEKLKVTGEVYKTFYKKSEIKIVRVAILSAKKIPGVLNVSKSNFKISLTDSKGNKETYFLWLRQENNSGMIMNIEDTHIGYTLQEADVDRLKRLLNM
jgi:hypothetical protein